MLSIFILIISNDKYEIEPIFFALCGRWGCFNSQNTTLSKLPTRYETLLQSGITIYLHVPTIA